MLLSGIKTGKRKRKGGSGPSSSTGASERASSSSGAAAAHARSSLPKDDERNRSVADELRRRLTGGAPSSSSISGSALGRQNRDAVGAQDGVLDRLERRGRIRPAKKEGESDLDADAVVLGGPISSSRRAGAMDGEEATLRREDFRRGARRGKLTKRQSDDGKGGGASMTLEEMVAEERAESLAGKSMDEAFARNVARLGSRYRGDEVVGGRTASSSAGADEDDAIDASLFRSAESRLTDAEKARRDKSRQIALRDREDAVASRCWYWMGSTSFERHRMLSLGDHVSLVLTPSHLALVPMQCYIVPVQHADSFASCEDDVWDEVARFRTSLRQMYDREGRGVLFCETVTQSGRGLWQARMDVVPVPKRVERDAELFFKSALTEAAEEWGTHTKLFSTRGKGLRRTIPKGFPYFNVEWDGGGFAQIIENTTKAFPRDFGVDTIAGMMEMDPVRFNRKKRPADNDRAAVLSFCEKWKEFDWTLELDG